MNISFAFIISYFAVSKNIRYFYTLCFCETSKQAKVWKTPMWNEEFKLENKYNIKMKGYLVLPIEIFKHFTTG